MAQAQYYVEIQNKYLNKHRRVTGRTRREVEIKAAEQVQRWSEQELRAREREAVADLKEQARFATENAQALLEDYRNILNATLAVDDRIDWAGLINLRPYDKPEPSLEQAQVYEQVPAERPFLERLGLKSRTKRQAADDRARATHASWLQHWNQGRRAYEDTRQEQNEEVEAFRSAYERGEVDSIERYVSLVLANSSFPEGFHRECDVSYSAEDKTLIVECLLPALEDLPTVTEYRYVASRKAVDEKRMKDKGAAALYEDVIIQTILRTVHEVFEGDYAAHCQLVVVNGVIQGVDRATGQDFQACIVSLQAERDAFFDMDLARVDPRACFRTLRGVCGASLASMQPIRPIRMFDKKDSRFIEADAVLDGLEADQNLMTMAWQDFEVLVRDLFQEVFSPKGGEVRVTRTSRDQGVDAIIFDADPLTGGKSVVQAKRYRGTVPVAAVRELYGTMMNEGAGKGILVTTSHFGASASEFAKDKPITLVAGPQLLHLLQNHGHNVRINLNEREPEEDSILDAPV